ncbi:MAG TPA: molybdopterin-dependent oxidoreductase [Candidatus Binataceae bacterium]|nr:molybdopterin-dependent oxidoreductase [Candidatus Binataceae bacterium]
MSDGLSRRSFLKLAATAGAAAAIPGCEPAARKIIPYVVPDENVIPGVASYFATTCTECSAGCGIIAKVREGRVIKLEGNPADPISGGAICARGQAGLQGLYNPDRIAKPMQRAGDGSLREISWDQASSLLNDRLQEASKAGKGRVAYIGSSNGPALDNVTKLWLKAWGSDRLVFWERIGEEPARAAADACFGRRDLPVYRLDQAETIVSFGADFLETWDSPVEYARQYAAFRAPKMRNGTLSMGKSAYVSPRLGTTGAKADEWVQAKPGTEGVLAMGVLNVVANQGWMAQGTGIDAGAVKQFVASYDPHSVSEQTGVPVETINKLGSWLGQSDGAVALAGGDDPQTYIAAYVLNAITGNLGKTMVFLENSPAETLTVPQDTAAVLQAIRGGEVDVVVVAGGANPAYSMPAAWDARAAIKRAPFVVWMGEVPDETAEAAQLLIPTRHALESWRDNHPRAGLYGLGQPVMQPVVASRALHDVLIESAHLGAGAAGQSIPWENASDAVNSAWQDLQGKIASDTNPAEFWSGALRKGGVFQEAKSSTAQLNSAVLQRKLQFRPLGPGSLALAAFPHIFLYDGRGADKPWLQEMPDPVSQIVWDSWAEIHPETAKQLGLKHDYKSTYLFAGVDVIEVSTPYGNFEVSVHITPMVMPGVLAMPIGQGHSAYGRFAKDRGINLWSYLPENSRSVAVQAHTTERKYKLVTPLGASDMMGRAIIEAMSIEELANGKKPEIQREIDAERPPVPYEMFDPIRYPGHKWGMTIDVNACTGCSACVAACYAENNLPVVGKEGVDEGHIMSWLRIERFIPKAKEAADAPYLYMAPILCQQCDHAPCEPVCPVFASHHTPEGLNAQIYNRCIGTRFCENNCPYKVRRFNWFDPHWAEPLNLQLNPDVTVRSAGVMEKCTFCIQRITMAEIDARTEGRELVDGEIITACAQACPARAISFGDLNDHESAMVKRRADNKPRAYTMLPEFNALPQITYLRDLYRTKGNA